MLPRVPAPMWQILKSGVQCILKLFLFDPTKSNFFEKDPDEALYAIPVAAGI
jgi:hypothetical protein